MDAIKEPLPKNGSRAQVESSVATILEREKGPTIKEWLERINEDENLCSIELDDKTRSSHLPQLFKELVHRLCNPLPLGTKGERSKSANEHGLARRKQGYSAAMLVEESRILQVSIFDTLRKDDPVGNIAALLSEVMVIADEADLQLAEAMTSFTGQAETIV
jgi:hypothetical protein